MTELLVEGRNAIGVESGDGWFNQTRVRILSECVSLAYGSPRLWAELRVSHVDGSESVVATDRSWRTSSSGACENNVYAGERFDARLVQRGWNAAGFDDSGWDSVVVSSIGIAPMTEQGIPPIRVAETLHPVAINKLGERCAESGFKKIAFAPYPIARLDWVRCRLDCAYGRIVSEWSVRDKVFTWNV